MNTVNLPSPLLSVFFSVSNVLQFICSLFTYFCFNFRFFVSSFRYLTIIVHKKSHFRTLIVFVTLSLVIRMTVLPVAGTVTGCVQIL
jgi:hypothetical protein